ncbi:MAG: hypothetical protein E7409_05000 [Ruminococcaceae bacterium]|nr:hypothetical protein [Oscillospiraceae bacterium]
MKIDKIIYTDGAVFERAGAKWIGRAGVTGNESAPAPFMRKKIDLSKEVKEAILYVTGLGQYEGFVNGTMLDERIVFAPTTSDYEKRVYYNKYDVTDKLTAGDNTLLFVLGRGRYAFNTAGTPWNGETADWIDAVKMLAVLEIAYADGTKETIVTDESWQAKASGVLQDCMYMGETFDARAHAPESEEGWENCIVATAPKGKLEYDYSEPIAITERVAPISCTKVRDGVFVYEFTPYITGWIELKLDCPEGCEVSIQYTERIDQNGEAILEHQITANGRLQKDFFISAGKPQMYRPMFSYKGFRYVQVEGVQNLTISDAVGCFIHNDIDDAAAFTCSNELLEWLHHAFRRTVLCNFHGLSSDTPIFEKHGWTNDAAAVVPSVLYHFNAHKFYRKWLNDIRDTQTDEGEISVIAPTPGWGVTGKTQWEAVCGPAPVLDVCYPELLWNLYLHYDDTDVLEEHYAALQKYVTYLKEWTKDDLCTHGLGAWLPPTGDPGSPAEGPEGSHVVSSEYHIRIFERMAQIASAMGKAEDAVFFAAERKRLIDLFNETYFDAERGYYCCKEYTDFRQTGNVLAVAFGIATPEIKECVLKKLLEHLKERDYHPETGVNDSQYLPMVLSDEGYHDIAYKVVTVEGYPGWDYMRKCGGTTFSEYWDYMRTRSRCHYTLGAVVEWVVTRLMGIEPLAPGYKKVRIDPKLPEDIDFATYSLDTVNGPISVKFERKNGELLKEITVSDGIEIVE